MSSRFSVAVTIIAALLLGAYVMFGGGVKSGGDVLPMPLPEDVSISEEVAAEDLGGTPQEEVSIVEIPVLASGTPAPDAAVSEIPNEAVLRFNMHLVPPSRFAIESEGDDYGVGDTVISKDGLTMRRRIDPAAPAGIYRVRYVMCVSSEQCATDRYFFKVE